MLECNSRSSNGSERPVPDTSEGLILTPQYAPRVQRVDLVLDIKATHRTLMLT
jgi:hypothetical protein